MLNQNFLVDSAPHVQLHDDRCMLNYIAENRKFCEIHGKKLWIDIQNQNFLSKNFNLPRLSLTVQSSFRLAEVTNDWQAVKRRFFESVVKDIGSAKYQLDSDTLVEFRKYCRASPSKELETSIDDETDSSIESIRFGNCNSSTPIKQTKQTGTRYFSNIISII